jgi:DNA-binding transcriptional ArsR family regulator
MTISEEDTYSMIFASLKHPIRRKILRILSNDPESFSDLQKQFKIESSHLTYHLEGLGNLLYKTEDGKYALSSLGEAAVSMMKHTEEPPETPSHLPFPSAHRMRKPRLLTLLLLCGLIASLIFNGVFLLGYFEPNKANLSRMPPISRSVAIQLALYQGGWDETKLQGMEVSANLCHMRFFTDDGWGYVVLEPVTENLTNYDPVTIDNSTYRYVWIVIVEQAGFMKSIPPPGYYLVDASSGEILPSGILL